MWVFPKIVVPQNGWFIVEHPIKMDDLGVPLFLETPMFCFERTCHDFVGFGACVDQRFLSLDQANVMSMMSLPASETLVHAYPP